VRGVNRLSFRCYPRKLSLEGFRSAYGIEHLGGLERQPLAVHRISHSSQFPKLSTS